MIVHRDDIIIALSTQSKTSTLILQREFERHVSAGAVKLIDDISEIKKFPISALIVYVAPTIDRSGALLDELIERNHWLNEREIAIIALCSEQNFQIADRLFRAGVHDCWPTDPESLSSLAGWIIRYVRRNTLNPKQNKSHNNELSVLAEDIRRKTFHETVATVTHKINNPLSAILAISERALSVSTDRESAGIEPMSQIHECADRILEVTTQLLNLAQPDSIETAAGSMIDVSTSLSEENQIAALARRRFAYRGLPDKLTTS